MPDRLLARCPEEKPLLEKDVYAFDITFPSAFAYLRFTVLVRNLEPLSIRTSDDF
jgi:hypothetical protein